MLPTQCAFSFYCLFFLHDLLHEGAHGLGGLVLLLPRGVGVGAEGESGIVMAQHAGHGPHIHAVLQGRGGKGVAQIMEPDVGKPRVFQSFLMEVYHGVRIVHLFADGRGEHVRAVRVLVMFLDQQIHRCLRDGYQPHRVFCFGTGELQGAVRVTDILLADGNGFILDIQVVLS